MDYLTKEQVDGLLEVFQAFDTSGNGVIDKQELAVIFRALGMEYSDAEIMDMLALKDKDGSGTLDFGEFLGLMASELRDASSTTELQACFEHMCGADGMIGSDELLASAADMGLSLSAAQADAMVQEVARDRAEGSLPSHRMTQSDLAKLMDGQ